MTRRAAILAALLAPWLARAQSTPLLNGVLQSDLDAAGHAITNAAYYGDGGGLTNLPAAVGDGGATNITAGAADSYNSTTRTLTWNTNAAAGGGGPESDPIWSAVSNTVSVNAANGATAYGWGNHATNGYITTDEGTNQWHQSYVLTCAPTVSIDNAYGAFMALTVTQNVTITVATNTYAPTGHVFWVLDIMPQSFSITWDSTTITNPRSVSFALTNNFNTVIGSRPYNELKTEIRQ